jgi:hypothetical protein
VAKKTFSKRDWERIRAEFDSNAGEYGLPEPVYGSALGASFNIRKLGARSQRGDEEWRFLADVCRRFDLLAIQEILDDLSGLQHLKNRMGPEFGMIVSDTTGVFPGEPGLGERLGFLYNRNVVERTEITTDITYDRSKLIATVAANYGALKEVAEPHIEIFKEYSAELAAFANGARPDKPKKPKFKVQLPVFLSFIRAPFCVGFRISGHPGTDPYEFLAINAHLYFGNFMSDRRQEFDALMEWILGRVRDDETTYAPNFVLLGDLNLDFDRPETDRKRIENHLRGFEAKSGRRYVVNFPFLDKHPKQERFLRTNARLSETFDQIGLFCRDGRFPGFGDNSKMGSSEVGPDYGVFEFTQLFSKALHGKRLGALTRGQKEELFARLEHSISDHMPLWLRMPLP